MKLARGIEKEESGDMVVAKHKVKMQENKKRRTKRAHYHSPVMGSARVLQAFYSCDLQKEC